MKKKYQHTEVSTEHFCRKPGCRKPIKERLVQAKGKVPELCYRHHKERKKAQQSMEEVNKRISARKSI
jgi:hypothetical protein